jgi:hypothetical protein
VCLVNDRDGGKAFLLSGWVWNGHFVKVLVLVHVLTVLVAIFFYLFRGEGHLCLSILSNDFAHDLNGGSCYYEENSTKVIHKTRK